MVNLETMVIFLEVEVADLKKSFQTDQENRLQEKHENVKEDAYVDLKSSKNFKCDMCSDDFERQ